MSLVVARNPVPLENAIGQGELHVFRGQGVRVLADQAAQDGFPADLCLSKAVTMFGAALALFDDLVYGGPLRSGYGPGEIIFSLGAVLPNLRYMPALPDPGRAHAGARAGGAAWITGRWVRLRRADDARAAHIRRDLAVGLAVTASWFSVWGLYAAYAWTAHPLGSTLQDARFYVPAIGAISLLGSWLVTRLPRRVLPVAVISVAVAMFGLGAWSFGIMHEFWMFPPA